MASITDLLAQTWTGAVDNTWSNASNWSTGVPGTTAIATFNSNTANTPNLTSAATVGQLLFNNGSDAETLTGLALTLNGVSSVGIDNQSGLTQTFNNTLIVAANQTWNATSGNLSLSAVTLSANLTLGGSGDFSLTGTLLQNGGNRSVTNNATGSVTLAGGVTGAGRTLTVAGTGDTAITGAIATTTGGLIKTGTGTLTLSGANTNTGATTVGTANGTSGGTLAAAASNVLSSGTTTIYAGTLDLAGNSDTIGALTLGGGASGTTAAVTTGAGTLTLGGNLTYTATNNPNGATVSGHLDLGAGNRTFTVNNSTAATDDLTVSANITATNRSLTVTGAGNTLISGSIATGTGALTKTGTGTLTLAGANSYGGTTTLSAGVLNLQNSAALGTTAAGTTVASGAALQLQGGIAVGAEALSITGTGVSTTGALRNISGSNSYAGAVTLTGNTQFTVDSGDLTLSGGVSGANRTLTITGSGDLTISGAIGIGTGGLIKRDSSTLTLAGPNSSTGATTIGTAGGSTTGTLRLGAAHGLSSGTLTLYSGTLDLAGYDDTIGALTLGGGATGTTASVTTGAGTLSLGGNLTYTATNNPNGATVSGHLDLGGANRTFNIGNSTNAADDLTLSANVSGSAGLIKSGTGTLVLTGANTYTGLTQITAGVLNIRHADALGSTAAGTTLTTGEELQLQGGIAVGAEALSIVGSGVSTTGALRNISGDNSFGGLVTLTGASRITTDAGHLTLSGGVSAANQALTVAGAADLTISGAINLGTGALIKLDAGTLTLSGVNSGTGATTLGLASGSSVGTVRLGAANGLAGGTLTNYASTLDLNGFNDTIGALTLGGGATGTTASVTTGAGTLTLGGNLTYTATNNPNGATVSGHLDLGGANRTFNIGDSTNAADDLTIDAVISGSAGFNKATGTGTLVLTGANTYSGLTQVTAGALNLRHSSALGSTAAGTVVTSGDQLQLQGGIAVGAETLSLAGSGLSTTGALRNISGDNSWAGLVTLTNTTQINADAGNLSLTGGITGANRALTLADDGAFSLGAITTGTGSLTKNGVGTATLTGTNTYSGDTIINAGSVRLGSGATLADTSDVVVATGATFDVNGQTDTVQSIAGAGSITLGSGALTTAGTTATTFSGVMSGTGSFTKQGTAVLTLSGANTYTGATTVSAGILRVGASERLSNATAVTVAAGATLDVNDFTETVATIAGAGTVDLGAGSLTTAGNGDTTFSGAIIGVGGSLTKQGAGTLTLSGASTYTGATSVDAGALRLGASDRLSNSTAVTIAAGATFDVNDFTETVATIAGAGTVDLGSGTLIAAGNGSTTFSGALTGTGAFTKQGSGILTLDNDLTFDGTFNLAGGTLRLSDIALNITTLNITGNSFIDFSGVSSLSVTSLNISGGVTLTIQNWADLSDYFFAQNWTGASYEIRGAAPMNQIAFTGFVANDTKWQEYDNQITPVPEPSTYGALLLAGCAGLLGWRRRRLNRRAA